MILKHFHVVLEYTSIIYESHFTCFALCDIYLYKHSKTVQSNPGLRHLKKSISFIKLQIIENEDINFTAATYLRVVSVDIDIQ